MAGLYFSSLGCIHAYTENFSSSRGVSFLGLEEGFLSVWPTDPTGLRMCLLPSRVVLPQCLVVVRGSGGGGDVRVGGEVLWEGLPTGLGVFSGLVVGEEGGGGWVVVFVEASGDGLETEDHGGLASIGT